MTFINIALIFIIFHASFIENILSYSILISGSQILRDGSKLIILKSNSIGKGNIENSDKNEENRDNFDKIVQKSVNIPSGLGFGTPKQIQDSQRKDGGSRSKEKRKYQDLLKIAKNGPSLKKIVKQGVDSNVAVQRDRKQQSSK